MKTDNKKAFTFIEVMVSMAIVLILASAMLTGGKYLRTRAQRLLTQSALGVIDTALAQYYEQTSPKQFPPQVNTQLGLEQVLYPGTPPTNTVTVIPVGTHPDPADADVDKAKEAQAFWSSETLCYFLKKVPQSKSILESLAERMLSSRDPAGTNLQIEIPTGGTTYDWVRFVDAWGTSLNYVYQAGDTFPVIISAGPDKKFGTEDDLKSNRDE